MSRLSPPFAPTAPRVLALIAVTLAAPPAGAAEPVPGPAGVLQMLPGLVFVLALIIALAWAARRFGAARAIGPVHIRTVASAAVGGRERVVVVEIAGEWMVLGVAPGRVSAIARIDKPADATAAAPAPAAPAPRATDFRGLLAQALRRT